MSAADGDQAVHARRRRMEVFAFLFLTAVLMPALAVAPVGGSGLVVWGSQIINFFPRLARRAHISGRIMNADTLVTPPNAEIASVLAQARPERLARVEAAIAALA